MSKMNRWIHYSDYEWPIYADVLCSGKSFILSIETKMLQRIVLLPVLSVYLWALVFFGSASLINGSEGMFSVGIWGILLDYLIFEEYGFISYAHIFPGNISTNFRNTFRWRSLVGAASVWCTARPTTTFKKPTTSSKHPQNTSSSKQSR